MHHEDPLETYRNMLRELAELAEHASLTGAMSSGQNRAVARYNIAVEELAKAGALPAGAALPLPADASFGELAVEARLTLAALPGNKSKHKHKHGHHDEDHDPGLLVRLAPFIDQHELGELVKEELRRGSMFDENLLTMLAPFLEQRDLSNLVRQWRESRSTPAAPAAPEAPEAPVAPEVPESPEPVQMLGHTAHLVSVDDSPNLEWILARLADPETPDDERRQLAEIARRSLPQ